MVVDLLKKALAPAIFHEYVTYMGVVSRYAFCGSLYLVFTKLNTCMNVMISSNRFYELFSLFIAFTVTMIS